MELDSVTNEETIVVYYDLPLLRKRAKVVLREERETG